MIFVSSVPVATIVGSGPHSLCLLVTAGLKNKRDANMKKRSIKYLVVENESLCREPNVDFFAQLCFVERFEDFPAELQLKSLP